MRTAESFGLNPRQARAAVLIAAGLSCRAAAGKCGFSERWLQEIATRPAFRSYVAHQQNLVIRRCVGRLTRETIRAVRRLAKLVASPDEGIALRASLGVLDVLVRTREHVDLGERVSELESLAAPTNGRAS